MLIRLAVENHPRWSGDYAIDLGPLTVLHGRGARSGLFRPLVVLRETALAPPWQQTIALLGPRGVETGAQMIAAAARDPRAADVTLRAAWESKPREGDPSPPIGAVEHEVRYALSPLGSPWVRSSVYRTAAGSFTLARGVGGLYALTSPDAPGGDEGQALAEALTRDLRGVVYLGPRRSGRPEGHTLSDPRLSQIGASGEGITETLIADMRRAEAEARPVGRLCEEASKWLAHLGLGDRLELEKVGQVRYRIAVVMGDGRRVPLYRANASVVRVLPVILLLLSAAEGATIVLERPDEGIPERAGEKLGEMLRAIGRERGVQILVEAAEEGLARGAGPGSARYAVEAAEDGALAITAAAVGRASLPAMTERDADPASEIAFAIVSGSPAAEARLAELCAELAGALTRPVTARVLPSSAALKAELEAGRAQILWAPPLVAIDLEDAGLASIALCCTRGGRADYHAAIFTRHASPFETLADLKGSHAAWVDPQSAAGYLVPRARIAADGLDPAALFGRESFLGTHARVACAVLDGEADAGATYLSLDPATGRPLSAGWLEAGAAINGAFILATAGPIPADAIVLSNRLPAAEKAAIVEQIKLLPSSLPEAIGLLLRADGFAAPEASHFEALRAQAAARKRA
jgi:phosphonate transport system substrate-binding protein